MQNMEHAIEHAAQAIRRTREFQAGAAFGVPEDAYEDYALGVARALAEAGLLAPAPLREEWGSEVRDVRPDRDPYVLRALGPDNAQWQIEHNPDYATGRIMHRYRTDWTPVDRAEGDGRADQ